MRTRGPLWPAQRRAITAALLGAGDATVAIVDALVGSAGADHPRAKIPGMKMSFAGLPKDDDIVNLIAFLKQFDADGKKQ
jgi:cytochrome c2